MKTIYLTEAINFSLFINAQRTGHVLQYSEKAFSPFFPMFSNIAYMSAIGDGEITRDEFIENGLKSGFVMNLMEYFEDVPDPEPEKCGKPRCRNKCRCEPSDGDQK